jgi:radical SAM protein with 4Fe4S-binding SPASM domain
VEDNTELKQYGKNDVIDWAEERPKIKSKFPQCRNCRYDAICEGPWREYSEAYGAREFVPVPGERIYTIEELLRLR